MLPSRNRRRFWECRVPKAAWHGEKRLLSLLAIGWVGFVSMGRFEVFGQPSEKAATELRQLAGVEKVKMKKAHRLEIGDRLKVKIYPEDEFIKGADVEVSSEGTITLSLLGKIKVLGMQVTEAEKEITHQLEEYLVSPVVVVEVAEMIGEKEKRSVSVLGAVQKPGSYEIPLEGKLTLLKVVSLAGGFSDVANIKKIKVIRKEGEATRVLRANAEAIISGKVQDIDLEPEDVIHVGESFF